MIGRRRKTMPLRHYITVLGLLTVCGSSAAVAAKTPGVTSTSIKIGFDLLSAVRLHYRKRRKGPDRLCEVAQRQCRY
jgi:hypothetical protein